jgi:hypothetical protein
MRKLLQRATLLALITGFAGLSALAQQAFVPGLVKAEVYSGFGGVTVADLTNNPAYPNRPSSVSFVKFLEYPPGADDGTPPPGDVSGTYGVRLSGFIIPAESGNYTFYVAADDGAAFFLSTNDQPAGKELLAWEPTWNAVRDFEGVARRPGCDTGDCENVSVPKALVAGQRYYFEALMKEDGGGDNLAVAWSKDGAPLETLTLGDGTTTTLPIKGLYLGTMADTTVSITRQPGDTAGPVGGTANFSVAVNATPDVTYQWRKNGSPIAGATSASYTTPALAAGDNNALYSVVVTKTGGNSVTSAGAKLTVAPVTDVSGVALIEIFNGIGGTAVPTTFSNLAPPNSYGTVTTLNSDPFFGSVPNSDPSRDNYLGKMSGYIIPTVSGSYDFFVRSDDASKLWVSPNATFPNPETTPASAHEQSCCRAYFEPFEGANADGTYPTTEAPIAMVAGQKYAFVYYWKEGGGGDYGQVAWRPAADVGVLPTTTIPAANLAASVPGLGITVHPQPKSVEENRGTSFTVQTLSTPGLTYQWQTAPSGSTTFTDIAGATSRTYSIASAPRADNGRQYRVIITSGAASQTSNPATLTVTDDVTAPTVANVGSFNNLRGLVVYFSEPVNASAGTFTLSGGATVESATQFGPGSVFIQTAANLTPNTSYTLTVGNVRDLSVNGGNLVSPTTATFTSSGPAPTPLTGGLAKYERWEGVSSIAQAITEVDARPADVTEARVGFEAPVNAGATYGGRLTGYFVPPSDGNYIFSLATDDNGRLWLSTDSSVANKKLIAQETGWAASRAWTGIPDKISNTFTGSQWPGRNPITLKGGQPYYMEAIWQEGGGGDNAAVTFWKEGEAMPGNGSAPKVAGAALLGNIALDAASPPLVTVPPAGRTFDKGDDFTLSVTAIGPGPFTYQWIKNKKPIAGATSATYAITDADHTDVGDYSVLVSNANGSVESGYRAGDDASRLIMRGAFVIEAEDYNYEGGKHLTVASTMPYLGNAYAGLRPTADVDIGNGPDEAGGDQGAYAYGPRTPTADPVTLETKGGGDAVNNEFNRNRGSFTIGTSYATGWGSAGDWQNYTRTFPAGRYAIIAGVANDGDPGADLTTRTDTMNSHLSKVANPTIADGSTVGVEGGLQGLTKLGVFNSPVSGAWSSNDLIPLTDEATGAIVEVQLSGTETLRWTNDSGLDMDYLLLYNLTSTPAPTIAISRAGGTVTINFTGTLQSSATLGTTANWSTVTGASNPYTVPTADAMRFFRSVSP